MSEVEGGDGLVDVCMELAVASCESSRPASLAPNNSARLSFTGGLSSPGSTLGFRKLPASATIKFEVSFSPRCRRSPLPRSCSQKRGCVVGGREVFLYASIPVRLKFSFGCVKTRELMASHGELFKYVSDSCCEISGSFRPRRAANLGVLTDPFLKIAAERNLESLRSTFAASSCLIVSLHHDTKDLILADELASEAELFGSRCAAETPG